MYKQTFPSALRRARQESKESLRVLAARCGLSPGKLTRLERGVFGPSEQERKQLAQAFPASRHDLLRAPRYPAGLYRDLKAHGNKQGGVAKAYCPPRDRHSRVRASAAIRQYSAEMTALLNVVTARSDFDRVNAFCDYLPLDSSLECLFVTELLASGAQPGFIAPNRLPPRTPLPAVCPKSREQVEHRPFPCLTSSEGIWIPQVSFLAERIYTVDFLRHFEGGWSIVEIDGRGHNPRGDRERGQVLGLSVTRLTERQVLERVKRTLVLAA